MRKVTYLLLLTFTLFLNKVNGQLWQNSDASLVTCWSPSYGFWKGMDSVYNAGDSLIGAINYKKIKQKTYIYFESLSGSTWWDTTEFSFLLRLSNDSLLLRRNNSETEGLLVYFGLQVGEQYEFSAAIDSSYTGSYNATLDSIKTYIFNGNSFRRFYFHASNSGLGTNDGFLPSINIDTSYPLSNYNIFPSSGIVKGVFDELFGMLNFRDFLMEEACFDEYTVCHHPTYSDYQYYEGEDSLRDNYVNCQSIVLKNENIKNIKNVNVYPNPLTEDILNIKFSLPTEGYLTLLNSMGSVVLQESFTKTNQFEISLNGLSRGVYFCRITSQGIPILTERVVKVR